MAFQLAKTAASMRVMNVGTASMAGRRAFSLLTGAEQADPTVPQFMVGTENGFLPRQVCVALATRACLVQQLVRDRAQLCDI